MSESAMEFRPLPPTLRWLSLAIVLANVVDPHLMFDLVGSLFWTLLSLIVVAIANDGDLAAVGFRSAPAQGWSYWVKMGLFFGAVIAVLAILAAALFYLSETWPVSIACMRITRSNFVWVCIVMPLSEVVIYCLLLVIAFLPTLGARWTIIAGGIIFTLIRIRWGEASVDSFVAGYILVWAFLKSGTILVPLAFHSAGNLIAFLFHFAVSQGYIPGVTAL